MMIERTDIANQAFAGATEAFLREGREKFHQTVVGQIEGSEDYPVDEIWQEDYMLEQLDGLLEQTVITDTEHMAIFASWIMRRRPDTTVLKVPPKPRGYGRGYHNE